LAQLINDLRHGAIRLRNDFVGLEYHDSLIIGATATIRCGNRPGNVASLFNLVRQLAILRTDFRGVLADGKTQLAAKTKQPTQFAATGIIADAVSQFAEISA